MTVLKGVSAVPASLGPLNQIYNGFISLKRQNPNDVADVNHHPSKSAPRAYRNPLEPLLLFHGRGNWELINPAFNILVATSSHEWFCPVVTLSVVRAGFASIFIDVSLSLGDW